MPDKKVRVIAPIPTLPKPYIYVVIYVRVSTPTEEQLRSASNQVSYFVQMISKNYRYHLVDVYLDFKSGANKEQRSEYQRMLSDAENNKFDLVFTKSISRFGRNVEEILRATRLLKEHKIGIVFDEEYINTSTMDSELLLSFLSAYAENENKNRSENVLWGIEKRLKDGTSKLYTKACYGYKRNKDGVLEIEPTAATIVTDIYNLYLSGNSIVGIIKQLEASHIPSPSGKDKWSKRSIENILTNEKYIGTSTVFKTYTKDKKRYINNGEHSMYKFTEAHPSIIPTELFNKVQEERKRRSNVIEDENGNKHRKETKYSSKIKRQ